MAKGKKVTKSKFNISSNKCFELGGDVFFDENGDLTFFGQRIQSEIRTNIEQGSTPIEATITVLNGYRGKLGQARELMLSEIRKVVTPPKETKAKKEKPVLPEETITTEEAKTLVTEQQRIRKSNLSQNIVSSLLGMLRFKKVKPLTLDEHIIRQFDRVDYSNDYSNDANARTDYIEGAKGVFVQGIKDGIFDLDDQNRITISEGVSSKEVVDWYNNLKNKYESAKAKRAKKQVVEKIAPLKKETQAVTPLATAEEVAGTQSLAEGVREQLPDAVLTDIDSKIDNIDFNKEDSAVIDEVDKLIFDIDKMINDSKLSQFDMAKLIKRKMDLRNRIAKKETLPHTQVRGKLRRLNSFFKDILKLTTAVTDNKRKRSLNKDIKAIIAAIPDSVKLYAEYKDKYQSMLEENPTNERSIKTELKKEINDIKVEVPQNVIDFMEELGFKEKELPIALAEAMNFASMTPERQRIEREQNAARIKALKQAQETLTDKDTTIEEKVAFVKAMDEIGSDSAIKLIRKFKKAKLVSKENINQLVAALVTSEKGVQSSVEKVERMYKAVPTQYSAGQQAPKNVLEARKKEEERLRKIKEQKEATVNRQAERLKEEGRKVMTIEEGKAYVARKKNILERRAEAKASREARRAEARKALGKAATETQALQKAGIGEAKFSFEDVFTKQQTLDTKGKEISMNVEDYGVVQTFPEGVRKRENIKAIEVKKEFQKFLDAKYPDGGFKANVKTLPSGVIQFFATKGKSKTPVFYTSIPTQEGTGVFIYTRDANNKIVSNSGEAYETFINNKDAIGASDSIPKEIVSFLESVANKLGLEKKIFVTTLSDIYMSDTLVDQSLAAAEVIVEPKEYTGAFVDNPDEQVSMIVFNNTKIRDIAGLLYIASHEISHAVIEQHFKNASAETRAAIKADFLEWLNKIRTPEMRSSAVNEIFQDDGRTWEDFKEAYKNYIELNESGDMILKADREGLFVEYLAEQVAAKLKQEEAKPQGILDKFFSSLASALRKIYNMVNAEGLKVKVIRPSIDTWINGIINNVRMANNASGQTDVSLEALSELKSRKAQGIETVIRNIKTGKERPAIGIRPEDNTLNKNEELIRRTKGGREETIKQHTEAYATTVNQKRKSRALAKLENIFGWMKQLPTDALNYVVTPLVASVEYKEKYFQILEGLTSQGVSLEYARKQAMRAAAKADKNGVVGYILHANHNMDTNKAEVLTSILHDSHGQPVYESAKNDYQDLTTIERDDYKDIMTAGDRHQIEFKTKEDAEKVLKRTVSPNLWKAYKSGREAINNIFKQGNLQRYLKVMDDLYGDYGDNIKTLITQAIYKKFTRNSKRKDFIEQELLKQGYSEKQINNILAPLSTREGKRLIVEARRALRFYADGGMPGAISHSRNPKISNPFVVRIKQNVTDKSGATKKVDRYVEFFPSMAEANAFVRSINSPEALNKLMPFENVNYDDYLDSDGMLQISAKEDLSPELNELYSRSELMSNMNELLVEDVITELGRTKGELDKDTANVIRKAISAKRTKMFMAKANARFMRRSKQYIYGFNNVNPLQTAYNDATAAANYIARSNYINDVTEFASELDDGMNLEAVQEIMNSLRGVKGGLAKASQKIANIATTAFMWGRTVTVLSQTAQYATFGLEELVAEGESVDKAAKDLTINYMKVLAARSGISLAALAEHARGDSTFGKFWRKVLREKDFKFMQEALLKRDKTLSFEAYTPEEKELLDRHSANRDTLDNITKELNSMEMSHREGVSTVGKDFLNGTVKAGMLLFNVFEIVNREASLITAYNYWRNKGLSKELADERAQDFMLRVNGDFNKYNKTKLQRKYPGLASIFALTSFAFHTVGMLGKRTGRAVKGLKNFEVNRDAAAMLSFAAMAMLVGGAKGMPLFDQLNRFWTILFGKDHLLDLERWAASDSGLPQWTTEMLARGVLAPTFGVDWSNNIAMRLPWVDNIYKIGTPSSDLSIYGAGSAWISGTYKGVMSLFSGDFNKALQQIPTGIGSNIAKAYEYSKKGFSTSKGGQQFFLGEPRKLDRPENQTYKMALGFKDLKLAREQDVISSERLIIDSYWRDKKTDALNKFFKEIDSDIRNNVNISKDKLAKAAKHIKQFNNKLALSKGEIIEAVQPIDMSVLQSGFEFRYEPKKESFIYQSIYEKLFNKKGK